MTTARWVRGCYVAVAVLLAAVAGSAWSSGTAPSLFTRDPAVLLNAHPLVGLVSNVGVMLWSATAAIALFTGLVLRARQYDRACWLFLLGAGLLTGWLLLDDLFLFHDWLFPEVLGVRSRFLFAAYILVTGGLFFRFRAVVRRTGYLVLAAAVVFFAVSIALDMVSDAWYRRWDNLYLAEDGAKLFGITSWFAYFVTTCAAMLESVESRSVEPSRTDGTVSSSQPKAPVSSQTFPSAIESSRQAPPVD
jgi:hypothetical protein